MSEDKDILLQWNPEAINNCTTDKRVEIMNMFLGRIEHFVSENQKLQSELTKTKAQLERAVEVVRFYANKENWASTDISRATGNAVYDICLYDFDRNLENRKDYAGSKARAFLAEMEGEND